MLTTVIAASLIATKSYSQVYVGVRFGHPGYGYYHRPYRGTVVYGGAYVAPAPVYAAPAPQCETTAPQYAPDPAYNNDQGYAPDPNYVPAPAYAPAQVAINYDEFPGYAYYNYPSWYGHFRDRVYYEHYRPFFMREHPGFYRGWHHGRRW